MNKAPQRQPYPAGRSRGSEAAQDTEDWSTATDEKEKKRIQNRVAQRAYRHRIKKRLEDLEQQVHAQNGTKHTRDTDEEAIHNSKRNYKRTKSKPHTSESAESQSMPDRFARRNNSHGSIGESPKRPDLNLGALPRFSPNVSPINPAIDSKAQQKQRRSSASQSFSQEPGTSTRQLNIVPEFSGSVFNSATVPEELMPPYNGQYQQDQTVNFLPHWSLDKDLNFLMIDETQSTASVLDSKSVGIEPMELEANTQNQTTEVEPQDLAAPLSNNSASDSPAQSSSSISSKKTSLNHTPSHSIPSTLSSIDEDNDDCLHPPGPSASIEKRIEYVLSCARQAGFDSLDLLITAYYGRELKQSSTLPVEQRMSRHRGLPQVLAELRQGSVNWSAWERNGYEDEILRAAEDICSAEYSQFLRRGSCAVEESLVDDLEANDLSNAQKSFQDELPRLWALLTSLTLASTSMSHRDRSNVVFASMLLSCYWGRAPSEQIMQWLQTCLEDSSLTSTNAT